MADPLGPCLVMILCLAGAAFVYALIAALPSADESRLKEEATPSNTRILRLLQRFDHGYGEIRLTHALLLAASYAAFLAAFGARLMAALSVSAAVFLPVSFLLYFVLAAALAALIPAGIAAAYPQQALRAAALPAEAALWVMTPILVPALWVARGVLHPFRMKPGRADEHVSEEDIRMMVDIGEEKGVIESDEKEMIENVFEFNNMTAADCMIHRKDITAIDVEEPADEVLQAIAESGLSRFPVFEDSIDNIIGVLTARDFLLNRCSPCPRPFRELIRPAHFVPESVRADVLFNEMQKRKQHISIVIDEYGGTSGLITLEDLLEEIVGNIYDEFDPKEEQDITPMGDDRWRVSGSVDLERLNEVLGCAVPVDDEFDTLGGLVFSRLTEIPADGAHPVVECYGLRISVTEISDRRVEWAMVEKMAEDTDAAEGQKDGTP